MGFGPTGREMAWVDALSLPGWRLPLCAAATTVARRHRRLREPAGQAPTPSLPGWRLPLQRGVVS